MNYQNVPIKIILDKLINQRVSVKQLEDTNVFIAQKDKKQAIFIDSYTSAVPYGLGLILGSRYNSRQILKHNRIPVAPAEIFGHFENNKAYDFAKKIGFPVLVRLEDCQINSQSYIGIKNQKQFLKAFNCLSEYKENILVEKFNFGKILRVFITKNGFFNVLLKSQPLIIGDGISSVEHLLILAGINHNITLPMDINPDTVLKKNKKLKLIQCTSISNGAYYQDITSKFHPSFYTLSKKIINSFPGLSYLGFEIITKNYHKKITNKNFIVGDVFLSPGPNINFNSTNGKVSHKTDQLLIDLLFSDDIQS
jgi:cyanophycin synthetase